LEEEMRAHIVVDWTVFTTKVLFYMKEQDATIAIKRNQKTGKVERIRIPHGHDIPDKAIALSLDREEWEALLEAISEQKLNPRREGNLEGKVDALKAHLEDMRMLVFKPDKETE
jgi:hypothetical protein